MATIESELLDMETKNIGPGIHYIQEMQPTNISEAVASWITELEPVRP